MTPEEIEARFQRIERSHFESVERLDRIEQLVESNARAIAANSEENRRLQASLNEQIVDVVSMLGNYADQAEQRHLQLEASLQTLINTLEGQFRGNGHNE